MAHPSSVLLMSLVGMLLLLPCVAVDTDTTVRVGVWLNTLGTVNVAEGTFEADVFLYLACDGAHPYASLNTTQREAVVEQILVNAGRSPSVVEVQSLMDEPGETLEAWQFRVKAQFYYNTDMEEFPYEKQSLSVILEDPQRATDTLVFDFADGYSGFDPATLIAAGWDIDTMTYEAKVTTVSSHYPDNNKKYSRFSFVAKLRHPKLKSFIKALLPTLFIFLIQLFTFSIPPKHATTRIMACGSSLTAAIMFHVNLESQTPGAAYLNYADQWLAILYSVIVLNFGTSIYLLKLHDVANQQRIALRVFAVCEWLGWVYAPALFILVAREEWIAFIVTWLVVGSSFLAYRVFRFAREGHGRAGGSVVGAAAQRSQSPWSSMQEQLATPLD